jgi:hypothetical protein
MMAVWRLPILVVSEHTANAQGELHEANRQLPLDVAFGRVREWIGGAAQYARLREAATDGVTGRGIGSVPIDVSKNRFSKTVACFHTPG